MDRLEENRGELSKADASLLYDKIYKLTRRVEDLESERAKKAFEKIAEVIKEALNSDE